MDDALTAPCEGIGVWEGARGFWRGRPIQIWEPMDGGRWATFHGAPDGGEQAPWFRYEPISTITLDLTHRPTRLEAMARLGARVGTDVGEGVLWLRMFARWTWMVDGAAGASASWAPEEDGAASIVPALADLDPTDDTRLPDGARLFDARALAIVLRHVFGVQR